MAFLFSIFEFVLGSLVEIAWYGLLIKGSKKLWNYGSREQEKRRRMQNMQLIRSRRVTARPAGI